MTFKDREGSNQHEQWPQGGNVHGVSGDLMSGVSGDLMSGRAWVVGIRGTDLENQAKGCASHQ